MELNRNRLFLLAYSLLVVGIAATVALALPTATALEGILAGTLVLLAGGLCHEVYARASSESRTGERLLSLRRAHSVHLKEINTLTSRMTTLQTALDSVIEGGSRGGSDARVDKVIAEVKVLQTLVQRLAEARAEREQYQGILDSLGSAEQVHGATEPSRPHGDPPALESHPLSPQTLARAAEAVDASLESPHRRPEPASSGPERKAVEPVPFVLSEAEILDVAQEALREDRIDLVLQPIVTLPQRKRRYYECFSRLRTREGYSVLPEQYIALAEEAGFVTTIDNMLLFRCVQLVRKIQRKGEELDFFCNISGRTLADDAFLGDFISFLEDNRDLAAHMIFEFGQASYHDLSSEVTGLLERLKSLGCRFSIDQVSDLNLRPAALAARGICFVKLTASKLLEALDSDSAFLEGFAASEVSVIVEKIEDEESLRDILDLDIRLAQGFLFSEPRLARPAA